MKTKEYDPSFEQAIHIIETLATWEIKTYHYDSIAGKFDSAFIGVDLTERERRLVERFQEGFTNLVDQYEELRSQTTANAQRLEMEIEGWKDENRDLGNKCERLEEILRDNDIDGGA